MSDNDDLGRVEPEGPSDDAATSPKPTLHEWLSGLLPFQLPTLPMPKVAKSFDLAAAKVLRSGGDYATARIDGATAKRKVRLRGELDELRTTEAIAKFERRGRILELTAEKLKAESPTEDAADEIDPDWLNFFFRAAEDKETEHMQELFSRILNGEIRKPGRFSLRTVQLMSTLTSRDAMVIGRTLKYVMDRKSIPNALVDEPPLDALLHLAELGVLHAVNGELNGVARQYAVPANGHALLRFTGAFGVAATNPTDQEITFNVGGNTLTQVGEELLSLADIDATEINFVESVGKKIKQASAGPLTWQLVQKNWDGQHWKPIGPI